MHQYRKDPIVDRWVIVCAARAERQGAFLEPTAWRNSSPCPFCEGHEEETPGEVLAYRSSSDTTNAPGWLVRVVPNKFPAVRIDEYGASRNERLFQSMAAVGAHEVVIESARHVSSFSDLTAKEALDVLTAYRRRLRYWKADSRMRSGIVFKNVGTAAGASLEHAHSQIIVLPMVPAALAAELSGALAYEKEHGVCPFCDMIAQEQTLGERMIAETDRYVALAPYASRLPLETLVLPKRHESHFESDPEEVLSELSELLRQVIGAIDDVGRRPAYNYLIHTAPFNVVSSSNYHWHIEIIPILSKTAGFEWASGYYVNPLPPEQAADWLRRSYVQRGIVEKSSLE